MRQRLRQRVIVVSAVLSREVRSRAMTTRQMLNRRFFRGWLAFVAMGAATALYDYSVPRTPSANPVHIAFVLMAMAGTVAYWWLTPCVQCAKALGWMGVTWRPARDAMTSPPCPHCGVSIDRDAPT